jgi:phospholipid/cholesterol/gamma-HCH transport system ATP-binding protein
MHTASWEIAFENLSLGYGERTILRDITATLPAGKISVILGGSGCGKSTLLKNIIGLHRPQRGKIGVGGKDLFDLPRAEYRRMRRHMGVLFQDGALLGALTLAQNVALPLSEHTSLPKEVIRKAAFDTLAQVGLREFGDYYPNELSGGMRKRAGLARAIIASPSILLCDEPTSGLDPITAAKMDNLLLSMKAHFADMTTVVVSHDMQSVKKIADYVLVLRDGQAIFAGSYQSLATSNDPYLQQFLHRTVEDEEQRQHEEQDPRVHAAIQDWLAS